MNKFKTLALVLVISSAIFVTSCTKDNDAPAPAVVTLTNKAVADLDGSKGNVYYSLSTNSVITGADTTTTKWDLKFSSTSILLNGGTSGSGSSQGQIVNSTFADLATAPTTGYKADAAGAVASAGWYTYTATTAPQHAILAVPGKILVIKTSAGTYAKVEMKSYYKGNPDTTTPVFADLTTRQASRFYTFQYTYQADGSTTLK